MTMQQATMFTVRLRSAIGLVVLLAAATMLAAARPVRREARRQEGRSYERSRSSGLARPGSRPPTPSFDDGEFLVDTNPVYVPAVGTQFGPAVSTDGTNYFVAWADYSEGYTNYDICAARMSPSGAVLDPGGIRVCAARWEQYDPAVAFDGVNYLVAWTDYRDRTDTTHIYAARVSSSGSVLDTDGIKISNGRFGQGCASVAFDGTNFLVVWTEYDTGRYISYIHGARVSRAGVVLDQDIPINTWFSMKRSLRLAFDGTNYFAVWWDSRNNYRIYGARINPSGVVIDTQGIFIGYSGSSAGTVSLAFGAAEYFVVWYSGWLDDRIRGCRVSPAGVVLDTEGIPIQPDTSGQCEPSVAFDGHNYLVVWRDFRNGSSTDIYCARVDKMGIVLDTEGIAVSTAENIQQKPVVASDGSGYAVAWQDERSLGGEDDIYSARVSCDGRVRDTNGILTSSTASRQMRPALASDGADFFAAWEESRIDFLSDIYGIRISSTGVPLDSVSIPVSTVARSEEFPTACFDGENYLVVWYGWDSGSEISIYGSRVSRAGGILDSTAILFSRPSPDHQQVDPAAASDGMRSLVVWQDNPLGGELSVCGVRIDRSGAILDTAPITVSAGYVESPAVAFDGTNYLVVWSDGRGSSWAIYGARVSQTGVVIDPQGIAISRTANAYPGTRVAFDGTNYLVVWPDYRLGETLDIYGARVAQSGVVLDPNGIAICTRSGIQLAPSVAFDGTNYIVVWQDYPNDESAGEADLRGARVSRAGVVVDSFPVVTQTGEQSCPALVSGPGDRVLLGYQGWAGTVRGRQYGDIRIWGKFGPFTGVAEGSSQPAMHSAQFSASPSPFRDRVSFQLAAANSQQEIRIYDVTGALVRSLAVPTMLHSATWDGSDARGRRLPGGVYLVRLAVSGKDSVTREILMLR